MVGTLIQWILSASATMGAIAPLLIRRYRYSIAVGLTLALVFSIILSTVSIYTIICGVSYVGYKHLISLDPFKSVFLLIIGFAGIASSIYGIGYMRIYRELGCGGIYASMLNIFLASMALVVLADHMLIFLFAWETMTIASIVLIGWEYNRENVVKAMNKYMYTMILLNTIPLILGTAILWVYTGSLYLEDLAPYRNTLISGVAATIMYIAFTSKAGLFPLHFWLPDAHPAAPSNVSSLLSGVMIKMGVYGVLGILYRYVYGAPWLYGVLLLQSILSIIWGSIRAIGEDHAKKLLAYSSISQIGFIVAPIVLSLYIGPLDYLIAAGLYYMVAHSLFKTLLFLVSGVYIYSAGTANLDNISGIAWRSKIALLSLLIATFSLAGLPPFAGYIVKASLYGSTLLANSILPSIVALVLLALSPLTLLYSIKFAYPALRLPIGKARETALTMKLGLGITSLALLLFGLIPLYQVFLSISTYLIQGTISIAISIEAVLTIDSYITYMPLLTAIALLIGLILGNYMAKQTIEKGIWTTGYTIQLTRHRIRPSNAFTEITRAVAPLTRFAEEVDNCICRTIPSKLARTGIATGLAEFIGSINSWMGRKIAGLAERMSSGREFKLDEFIGHHIVSLIRIIGNFIRVLSITPIGLLTIASVFLALLLATILAILLGG